MTYPPFPSSYSANDAPSSVGPTARYAGVLLLIFSLLTLFTGGCTLIVGLNIDSILALPEVKNDSNFQKAISDLRSEGVDLQHVILVMGILSLVYAIPGLIVSILLMVARSRVPVVLGLLLVGLALLPMILLLILSFAGGNVIGGLFWMIVLTLHGLILVWLVSALRRSRQVYPYPYAFSGPSIPPPMQQYQSHPPSDQAGSPAANPHDP